MKRQAGRASYLDVASDVAVARDWSQQDDSRMLSIVECNFLFSALPFVWTWMVRWYANNEDRYI